MRARTEDLLTLRDGEPMDAGVREALLADPASRAEIERLDAVRAALESLPELQPPPEAWERIAARVAAADGRPVRPLPRLLGGAALALAVAAAALWLVARPLPEAGPPPATTVAGDGPGTPAGAPFAPRPAFGQPSYASLVERSARLERLLAEMRDWQRPVMSGGTASTIAGLEDRIIVIDEQLTLAAAEGMRPEEREALWRQRVNLMNALVHVRMAQSERGGF
ncbi:MAG TPA: hypothetical protein VF322_06470 [Gammaproteobacteria bacterium]